MSKNRSGLILWLVIIGVRLVMSPVSAQEFPTGLHWKQIETDNFIILFDEQHRDIAQDVARMAEPVHQRVIEFLQYTPASKTYVILTDHEDYFNGYATPIPNNKVVLFLHEPGAGDSFFGIHSSDWLTMVFTHEYTHIVHTDMVEKWYGFLRKIFGKIMIPNLSLPLWMIEGLAVYSETKFENGRGSHPHYEMMMRTDILEDAFKPLDQMSAVYLRKWPTLTVVYLYGYFFMQYLADTYGEESIVQLNHANAQKFPIPFGQDIFKKTYDGKNLTTLWREWRDAMKQHYQSQIEAIKTRPVTETRPLSTSGYYTNSPVFSPDGKDVYYIDGGPHDEIALVKLQLSDGTTKRLTEGAFSGNFSISEDGRKLYFCKADVYKTAYIYSDLYVLDIETEDVHRLTKGMRAFDPAISPDGKTLVFTVTDAGSMNLMRMDLETQNIVPILETADHTQLCHPAFSSDGTRLTLQIWKEGGFQDIYIMNSDGSDLTPLTSDIATDSSPVWGRNDEYVFFSSDRTGVPNIFAYALKDKTLYQVTNVLTGVFDPDLSPDGSQMVFEQYSSRGMDIHLAELNQEKWLEMAYDVEQQLASELTSQVASISPEGNYNPLPSLLPKLWLPAWGLDEKGLQLGFQTYGVDPLSQHEYSLSALYGVKSRRMSFFGSYTNNQWYPEITLYGYDTATPFFDIFRRTSEENEEDEKQAEDYWQRDIGGGIEIAFPVYRSLNTEVYVGVGYRYNNMESLTDDPEMLNPAPDEGVLSGLGTGFYIEHLKASIYAISPEQGFVTSVTYVHDDKELGSDFDLDTVVGETAVYLKVPKLRHHVLALKAAGGLSEGETLSQGIFRLGGYSLSTGSIELSNRQFFLRGYDDNAFSGNRVAVGSAEYHFPIWYPQRGLLKGWLFFDSTAGAAFYDIGNAWDGETEFSEFKDSVGGELRINFGLHYNEIPFTLRLGYAEGLDEEGESQFYFAVEANLRL